MKGGKRPGAGRKPGVPNKATAQRQAMVAAGGDTPLDFLLAVMRGNDAPLDVRLEAAKAAAPYVHPKLASVTLKGDEDEPVRHVFEWAKSEPSAS